MDANHLFAKAKDPLSVDAGHADDAVTQGLAVYRAFPPFRISEDGGHRRVPCKPEIREGTIIPDGRRRELFSGTDRIVCIRRIGRNRPGGLHAIFRIAELHDIEGGALGLLDVEVIAATVGIDRDIGMNAARDGLDREGLSTWDAIDFKALCVACNDRADAFAFTELHRGNVCE